MHEIYNPLNLLGKEIEVSYHQDDLGEDAKVVEIEAIDGQRVFEIVFAKYPETEDDERFIWTTQEPYEIVNEKACFSDIGHPRRIYLNLKKPHDNVEDNEITTSEKMRTTIKELSVRLDVDPVYVNGFIQTLMKIGVAKVVGKVEKPNGGKGKPSNIYEIGEINLDILNR
jgi:hypothetical protein